MSTEEERVPPVEVPVSGLSSEALTAVIENFVLQEGTDYGAVEASLAVKVAQIRHQVEKGDVKVIFDSETESVTLMNKNEFQKLSTPL